MMTRMVGPPHPGVIFRMIRTERAVEYLCVLLGVLVGALATLLTMSAPASADETLKIYIVKTAEQNGGKEEFLYDIAERTLQDGKRYQEIFKINQRRPQPGGDTLTDPRVLEAGWRLILPSDAFGPDVLTGRLDASGSIVLTGDSAQRAPQPPAPVPPGSEVRSGQPPATARASASAPAISTERRSLDRTMTSVLIPSGIVITLIMVIGFILMKTVNARAGTSAPGSELDSPHPRDQWLTPLPLSQPRKTATIYRTTRNPTTAGRKPPSVSRAAVPRTASDPYPQDPKP